MKPIKHLVLALAVATAFVPAPADAAIGGGGIPADNVWLSCSTSTAEILGLHVDYSVEDWLLHGLTYRFTPCKKPLPNEVYGIALYTGAVDASGNDIVAQAYTNTYTKRLFLRPEHLAVCIITGPTTRITCSALVADGPIFHLGEPLPTDAPIVSVPAKIWLGPDGSPTCPPCF